MVAFSPHFSAASVPLNSKKSDVTKTRTKAVLSKRHPPVAGRNVPTATALAPLEFRVPVLF
jgi:hypothetical protein